MLADPNDESPANVDAAKEWRDNYPEFKSVAPFVLLLSLSHLCLSVVTVVVPNRLRSDPGAEQDPTTFGSVSGESFKLSQ